MAKEKFKFKMEDYFTLLTGEDIFDGNLEGDLSPVEYARVCDTTDEDKTFWEDFC